MAENLSKERNWKMKTEKNVSRRAVVLSYKDAPGKSVCVTGSFNDWRMDRKMTDRECPGEYRCRLLLVPGEYQYKFVVDGEWRSDPENPNFVPNGFGSLNSVLIVKEK